mmetsp:Transcript_68354/g.221149  ORF Transcript_68354/g.221149 Transcript_68354/m.221149 type:complete len:201 (-) Transcript_68354:323-925(-)
MGAYAPTVGCLRFQIRLRAVWAGQQPLQPWTGARHKRQACRSATPSCRCLFRPVGGAPVWRGMGLFGRCGGEGSSDQHRAILVDTLASTPSSGSSVSAGRVSRPLRRGTTVRTLVDDMHWKHRRHEAGWIWAAIKPPSVPAPVSWTASFRHFGKTDTENWHVEEHSPWVSQGVDLVCCLSISGPVSCRMWSFLRRCVCIA